MGYMYSIENEIKDVAGINVNVTKIVKYVCVASVFIIAIIFGTRCIGKILEMKQK
jgi:hypothetical protein